MKEDIFLLGQIEDKINQCENRYIPVHTGFLDAHQQSLARNLIQKKHSEVATIFYGGYEDADRSVLLCLPDYATVEDNHPLTVLRVSKADGGRELTHRDYLGSLVGIGIKRELTGDILVRPDGADIILLKDIAEVVLANYIKVGRTTISLTQHDITQLIIPQQDRKVIKDTVASLRIDNIIASAFNLSRSKAAEAITRGLVFVNHIEMSKTDFKVSEGDCITLRGKGKINLIQLSGKSRKDRLYVTYEKY